MQPFYYFIFLFLGSALAYLGMRPKLALAEQAATVKDERVKQLEAEAKDSSARLLELSERVSVAEKAAVAFEVEREHSLRLVERVENLEAEKEELQRAHSELSAELATSRQYANSLEASTRETIRLKDLQLQQERDTLREQIASSSKQFENAFEALSGKALKSASDEFLKTAKATFETIQEEAKGELKGTKVALEEMLKPFDESMKALDKRCQETDEKAAAARSQLDEQLAGLVGDLKGFNNAIRRPVSSGHWGERTLQNVLEASGLVEGHDYVLQHSTDSEDGKLRADAVVNLSRGRKLVIDSKNLWDAYTACTSITEEPARSIAVKSYIAAVRGQIKSLSAKSYWQQYDGLDCVVMFLPYESMYQLAIENDKALMEEAIKNKVYVASPLTISGMLRAVSYVLDQERLNQNAVEISEIGKRLYDSLRTFGNHFEKVGNNLRRTVDSYNESAASLETRVLSRARQLKSKGVEGQPLPELKEIEQRPSHLRSDELTSKTKESVTPLFATLEGGLLSIADQAEMR